MSDTADEGGLKAKVAKGSMWVALEQLAVQGMNFGVGIVLARLLGPNAYGTVALVTIFISIAQVLANSGMGQALVQKADSDESDFNSVFCASAVVSVVLYGVLFLAAPFIARFYGHSELTAIVRVLALNLFCFSFNSVQSAELYKRMRFDITFRISIIVSSVTAVVGIGLAWLGYGVWSYVWSSVLSNLAGVIARMAYIDWHPRFRCDFGRLRALFSFGWKLMVSSLMGTISSNLNGMLIGKFFSNADLAYVNKGRHIPSLVGDNLRQTIIESTFPAMAQLNSDRERMTRALHRMLSVALFVVCPVMLLLGLVSSRLIPFLYGSGWTQCIPYTQITCVGGILWTVVSVNSTVLMALGQTGWMLKISILMNVLSLANLIVFLPHGVLPWVAADTILSATVALVAHVLIVRRHLAFGFLSQMRDAAPTCLLTAVMAAVVMAIGRLPVANTQWASFGILAVQGISAIVTYVLLAVMIRAGALCEIFQILRPRLPQNVWFVRFLLHRFGIE